MHTLPSLNPKTKTSKSLSEFDHRWHHILQLHWPEWKYIRVGVNSNELNCSWIGWQEDVDFILKCLILWHGHYFMPAMHSLQVHFLEPLSLYSIMSGFSHTRHLGTHWISMLGPNHNISQCSSTANNFLSIIKSCDPKHTTDIPLLNCAVQWHWQLVQTPHIPNTQAIACYYRLIARHSHLVNTHLH